MSEKGITTFWECECSAKNPLRFRKCKACGRDMPDSFAHKIYYEELKAQKAFVFVENAEKSKIRCLKIGSFLEGWENAIVPIMIMLVICLLYTSGIRFQERAACRSRVQGSVSTF